MFTLNVSRAALATILVGLTLLVSACVKSDVDSSITSNPGCDASITPTGKTEKRPDKLKASSCKAVVLMCNYCEYSGDGMLKKVGSDPCGVCVGTDF